MSLAEGNTDDESPQSTEDVSSCASSTLPKTVSLQLSECESNAAPHITCNNFVANCSAAINKNSLTGQVDKEQISEGVAEETLITNEVTATSENSTCNETQPPESAFTYLTLEETENGSVYDTVDIVSSAKFWLSSFHLITCNFYWFKKITIVCFYCMRFKINATVSTKSGLEL